MKRIIASILPALLFAPCLSAQPGGTGREQPLSFEQAVQITMTGNPRIDASHYEEKAAEHERKAAFGLRLPKLGVTGAYAWMEDDIGVDLNSAKAGAQNIFNGIVTGMEDLGIAPDPSLVGAATQLFSRNWGLTIQERDLAFVGGTLTMPIFMGGKINAANRAARINEQTAQRQGDQTRAALMSELVERYFGLSLAHQAVKVREQVVEAMKSHLKDAVALEKNGIIARSERLYVEVKLSEAERDLIAARLKVNTTGSALSNTLNQAETYMPVSDMFFLEELPSLEELQATALEKNPQLQQVALKKQLAEEGVKAQRAEFMPQVSVMGAGRIYNYNVSRQLPNWIVGGGVSFNIFDGLHREHKYSSAKYTVRQVETLRQKAESDIAILVENLYNELLNYRQRMPSIEASLSFAQEYLRVKNAAFLEGVSPSLDVVDAEVNLAGIRIEKLQTAFQYDLTLAKLLEAAGISDSFAVYAKSIGAKPVSY